MFNLKVGEEYMEEYMNYREVRIEQLKEKECVENRTIWINEDITDTTEFMVLRMFDKIVEIDKKNKIKPENADIIHLKISSYGGSCHAGIGIIEYIEKLKRDGYRIYGYAYGKCMSCAFKIFISCTKRLALSGTDLMCHMPNHFEYCGQYTMTDDKRRYDSIKRTWVRLKQIILKYTNIPEEMLDNAVDRNDDLYFWADESIKQNLGIVDELI